MDERTQESMPSPPYPDPLSPVPDVIVRQAFDAYQRESDVASAIAYAAVHAGMRAISRARTAAPDVTSAGKTRTQDDSGSIGAEILSALQIRK